MTTYTATLAIAFHMRITTLLDMRRADRRRDFLVRDLLMDNERAHNAELRALLRLRRQARNAVRAEEAYRSAVVDARVERALEAMGIDNIEGDPAWNGAFR